MIDDPSEEKHSPRRLILPSLVISRFATQPPGILTGLLLIDIGLTFGSPVGVVGQIRTLSSSVAVISALIIGAFSVRFKHKSLLFMGLLCINISALGCSFAFNFGMMLVSYSLSGLGLAMITSMTTTLVAEHFTLEKRGSAVGWLVAGMSLSYLVGAPIIRFIAGFGSWRLAFIVFVLPVSLLSLLLVVIGLPSSSLSYQPMMSKGSYVEGFKGVFSNRFAVACLVGTALSAAAWQAILLYSVSFLRQRFRISTHFASIYLVAAALCFTLGSLISGRFVNRFGRKFLTVLTAFIVGIFTISYANVPNLRISMALAFLGSLFSGMRYTASDSLTLEQVPRFRATIMSINSAASSTGAALGAGVGGFVLLLYDWEFVGISLGAMGIAAAIIYYLLTIDPTRIPLHDSGI